MPSVKTHQLPFTLPEILGWVTARFTALLLLSFLVSIIVANGNPFALSKAIVAFVVGGVAITFLIPRLTESLYKSRLTPFGALLIRLVLLIIYLAIFFISFSHYSFYTNANFGYIYPPLVAPYPYLIGVWALLFFFLFILPGFYIRRLMLRAIYRARPELIEEDREKQITRAHATSTLTRIRYVPLWVKILFIPFAVMILGMIAAVFWFNFLPNERTEELALYSVYGLFGYFLVSSMIIGHTSGWLGSERSPGRRWGDTIGLFVLTVLMGLLPAYSVLSVTAPQIHSYLSGGKVIERGLTVSEKVETGFRNLCGDHFLGRWTDDTNGKEVRLCKINPQLFSSIEVGNSLIIVGTETRYGLRVDEIQTPE